jgi:hypothetical protein
MSKNKKVVLITILVAAVLGASLMIWIARQRTHRQGTVDDWLLDLQEYSSSMSAQDFVRHLEEVKQVCRDRHVDFESAEPDIKATTYGEMAHKCQHEGMYKEAMAAWEKSDGYSNKRWPVWAAYLMICSEDVGRLEQEMRHPSMNSKEYELLVRTGLLYVKKDYAGAIDALTGPLDLKTEDIVCVLVILKSRSYARLGDMSQAWAVFENTRVLNQKFMMWSDIYQDFVFERMRVADATGHAPEAKEMAEDVGIMLGNRPDKSYDRQKEEARNLLRKLGGAITQPATARAS